MFSSPWPPAKPKETAVAVALAAVGRLGTASAWSPDLDDVLGLLRELCCGEQVILFPTVAIGVQAMTSSGQGFHSRHKPGQIGNDVLGGWLLGRATAPVPSLEVP
jgi:hypothetical protein